MNSSLSALEHRLGADRSRDNRSRDESMGRNLIRTLFAIPKWLMLVLLLALGAIIYFSATGPAPLRYITAEVSRGTVAPAVSATGTINPVTTVQVGSYVSGPIQAIYADFNSPVKQGQVIAKIDPRTFQMKVEQAKAALANAQAQLKKDQADAEYKKITWQRQEQLYKAQVVSADVSDSAKAAYKQAQAQVALDGANVAQQQSSLKEAQVNLDYTDIVSPVDGTVVSRNVDVGQTVAASFQTPTLFLIAKDLTHMQVDTNVSESDIGGIKPGQTATFVVDAFPGHEFQGVVTQVRQAPITVQNVVTYDVVIGVQNPELLLKPGMTANVTLQTARHDGVLRVPVQAMHFRPSNRPVNAAKARTGANHPAVWIDEEGNLRRVGVTPGLNDGEFVEILGGDLHEGQMVAIGEAGASSPARTGHSPLAGARMMH
jgi:HlyD family secretion protein